MTRNNHDRPEFSGSDLDYLLSETQQLRDISLVFSKGRICDISTADPEMLTYLRNLHHLERYQFLKQYLSDSRFKVSSVLDIGVGEGNGANELLASDYFSVAPEDFVGLEIEPEIAKQCQTGYPQITVVQENVLDYRPERQFDLVICFELLGNASLESDDLLLQKVKAVTAHGGMIAMSIAIFDESEFGRKRKKYYSSRIYNRSTFAELFEKNFPGCEKSYFGQYYPLKRFREEETGVWSNPDLLKMSDFALVVVKND